MAQRGGLATGQKRGPGRPPKNSTPAAKRQRLSTANLPARATSAAQSPVAPSPVVEKKLPRLPSKVVDGKPLPTLSEPLPLPLSDEDYQTIAASAVLPASLDRSRLRWVHDGVFQRYWVKPETGKHAKPPPPNNPEVKWMKHRGHCRIRIEPHIFECDVYVEEKVKPPPPPKQYVHSTGHNTFGQPYRPPVSGHQPFALPVGRPHQQQPSPQLPQPATQHGMPKPRTLPPVHQASPSNPPGRGPAAASSTQQPDKKLTHDPVISMLASRASSDPELKALMKEVATGNASQEQLKIFQRHIDELTAIIQKQRKQEEELTAREQQRAGAIQYDSAAEAKGTTAINPPPTHHPPPVPYQPTPTPVLPPPPAMMPPPPPPPPAYRQPTWTPPAPASLPVILGFTTPGATEDRFWFPQHSILESLSPQHTLVSFIVTRKGREASDASTLDPDKEYWQPVTMMVEVAYGREEILACIRRWAKPADEVRKHMEEVMARCERAPKTYLALRLPFRSTAVVEVDDTARENTPVTEDRVKSKAMAKQSRKNGPADAVPSATADPAAPKPQESTALAADSSASNVESAIPNDTNGSKPGNVDGSGNKDGIVDGAAATNVADATAAPAAEESSRPKRPLRKSVRISEA